MDKRDDYYSKSPTTNNKSHSTFQPQTAPLPPTPTSTNSKSLYSSKSNNNLDEEFKNGKANSPTNIYPERKTSHAKPLKINIEDYSNRKYNGASKLSESFSEREDMGSVSPASTTSNSLSISYDSHEPISPSSSFYHRNQYNQRMSSKRSDNYNGENNSLKNDYNDYDMINISHSRSNSRSEIEDPNIYNSRRNEYGGDMYDYDRNRNRDRSKSRTRERSMRDRERSGFERDRERNGFERDRERERGRDRDPRADMEEYERFNNRREVRDDDSYRTRSKSRTRNPNPNYRNPSTTFNNASSFMPESNNYDKDKSNEKILRNQSSVSSLSYEIKKNASIKSNSSNNSMGRAASGGNGGNQINPSNSFNNNYTNSPRMRPSPPSTPVSRPSTPNLNRPSTPNLNRPSTPNLTRPSTPNLSRPSTPNLSSRLNNMRRPSTPLNSSLINNNYSTPDSTTVRSNYTKIRVNYNNQEFIIVASSSGCTYGELISKIERKIRLNERTVNDNRPLRIRYKDEDDDFVTIITDEDINLAFDIATKIWKANKDINEPMTSMVVNLYVDRK